MKKAEKMNEKLRREQEKAEKKAAKKEAKLAAKEERAALKKEKKKKHKTVNFLRHPRSRGEKERDEYSRITEDCGEETFKSRIEKGKGEASFGTEIDTIPGNGKGRYLPGTGEILFQNHPIL